MALSPVLSKERPDHPSLDYEVLRTEGIRHLENLATEVWTDFNAHDPGITMLELLSYAITDLGYRTRLLPIADLVAGNKEKSFFEPLEILPCAPVTAADYRKILIDIEGVKNAWVQPYQGPSLFKEKSVDYSLLAGEKFTIKEITAEQIEALVQTHNQSSKIKIDLKGAKEWLVAWQKDGIPATTCQELGVDPAVFFDPCLGTEKCPVPVLDPPEPRDSQCAFLFTLLCQYGYTPLQLSPTSELAQNNTLYLNGLFKITLDLDDDVNPENESETRPILDRVMKRLNANRFLGQDYVKPFTLVKKLPIALCLHLEVAPGKNSLDVAAEALWQIEQHLTPTLRFYTFKEMLDKGHSIDEIYNGPLLDHGFLDNQELEKAQLLKEFRHSDLSNAATVHPDVLTVHELKVKVFPDKEFCVKTSYPIFDPNSKLDEAEQYNPTNLAKPLKPVIDICKSCVYVTQNGVRCELQEEALAEALELKRMLAACHDTPGGPVSPLGNFRKDLDEYLSLQYDLPGIYGVGEYGEDQDTSPVKLGKRKQLQAYLAFFDQIFAAYLKQLGALRNLFAVHKNPHSPTYQAADLKAIPGMFEIIDPDKPFVLESQATQQDRSNRLLGHLLARFGEAFSEYTAALANACKTNSNAGYFENYSEFLSAKAAFLKEIPDLGFSRGMAYDYSGGKEKRIWNTPNVPGIKKRVHRLIGLKGSWSQQSLLSKPAYRLDIVQLMSQQRTKQYQIVFKVLEENTTVELPYKGILLRSSRFGSLKLAEEKRQALYATLPNQSFFQITQHPRENAQQTVAFSPGGKMELWSDPLDEQAAADLFLFIQDLVVLEPNADKEGFHVLEHILLRPNDRNDLLLELSLGNKPQYTPRDPYSNWLTVVAPNWTEKFKEKSFQQHFEQSFRREAPAEMAFRFCWLDKKAMQEFEEKFKAWLEAKANCSPNECHITETANELIDWLNKTPCSCSCQHCCTDDQACRECRECNNEQLKQTTYA